MKRYSFSGHESFQCKSIWLKKGYDFLVGHNNFTSPEAVALLGVGKNMVGSIRFWLKAFGLTSADELQPLAHYLFDSKEGRDPFVEDKNTLWLLHFLLVNSETASLYSLLFVDYQREKREFVKADLQAFVKRKCAVPFQRNAYNENTVKKDIGVLLKNYVTPGNLKSIEDFSALLLGLGLISQRGTDSYVFKAIDVDDIAAEVILFAMLWIKGEDKTVSFDGLQKIALIFCIPLTSLLDIIRTIEKQFPEYIVFSDNSGIRNVHFLRDLTYLEVLDNYYQSV